LGNIHIAKEGCAYYEVTSKNEEDPVMTIDRLVATSTKARRSLMLQCPNLHISNLMPRSLFNKIERLKLKPKVIVVNLVDGSVAKVEGIVENVMIIADKLVFSTEIMVMEINVLKECNIILGRSFLPTDKALINVEQGEVVVRSNEHYLSYNVGDEIAGQFSDKKCRTTRVRNTHPSVALKRLRQNPTRAKEPK